MRRLANARGAMLIQVGLSILMLMGLMVFVFDNGILWIARGQAQNAADGAALSGAVARAYDEFDDPPPAGGLVQTAADLVVATHQVWNQVPTHTVSYNCPPGITGGGCVQVDVFRNGTNGSNNLPQVFGALMGVASHGVRATATAQAAPANATSCLKPWAVADKWLEANTPPWMQSSVYEPALGDTYVPPYGTGGTGFSNKDANGDPVDWGLQMTLKLAHSGPAGTPGTLSSGWSMALDLPQTQNPPYENNISGCTSATVAIAAQNEQCNSVNLGAGCIDVLTGGIVGQTDHGVDDIMASDSTASWNRFANGGRGAVSTTRGMSPRVVPVAVFDTAMYVSRGYNGTNGIVKVVNFLGFFVEGICSDSFYKESYLDCSNNAKDVVGRLITFPAIYAQTGGSAGNASFGVIIRLVR